MTATEGRLGKRLRRILLMLPYAIKHPGVSIEELSNRFSVSGDDLLADLHLVFMCGLPGYGPGDLIDVSIEDDKVFVTMADYFSAPLRLTPTEALMLYASAAAITSLPEMEGADALRRALRKLGAALDIEEDGGLEIRMEAGPRGHLSIIKEALEQEHRIAIEYLSATSGRLAEREIDPWGIVAARGRWYLIGWDHSVEDERMFRIDRVKRAEILDLAAKVPDDFDPDRYKGAFVDRDSVPSMTLEISPEAALWFLDYYPTRSTTELPDGWVRVELAVSGKRWAAMLVVRLGSAARAVSNPEVLEEAESLAKAISGLYD